MHVLTPLHDIRVPDPQQDSVYAARVLDREVQFKGLKRLLGAADYSKAGDRGAGLAATNEDAREAARTALSDLTLEHLYDHPLTDDRGQVDSVMRVNYDIDLDVFGSIASLTVGDLKDHVLGAATEEGEPIGR